MTVRLCINTQTWLARLLLCGMMLSVVGCSSTTVGLTAPCPHFGIHCRQVPVNRWDDNGHLH